MMKNFSNMSAKPALSIQTLLVVFLCLLASCERQSSDNRQEDTVLLMFSEPSIRHGVDSKASIDGDNFPYSHSAYPIGLWLMMTDDHVTPQIPGFDNLKAEYLFADGVNRWDYYPFGPDKPAEQSLKILKEEPLDIYAYYPWVSGADDLTAIPFLSGEDDWMTALPVRLSAEDTKSEVQTRLDFRHLMTCIEVRINCRYDGSITLTSMTLSDSKSRLVPSGTFDCTEEDLSKAVECDASTSSLTVSPRRNLRSGYWISAYFIMPAVENLELEEGEMKISFVFNNIPGETEFLLPAKMKVGAAEQTVTEFKQGYKYIYSLMLDNTMDFIPVGVEKDWTTEEILLPI